MLFTDPIFLFYFLPAVLVVLRIFSLSGRANALLKGGIVTATLVFYAYEDWIWLSVFGSVALTGLVFGYLIDATDGPLRRKWLVGLAVTQCVLILGAFKYLNWLSAFVPGASVIRDWLLPWYGDGKRLPLPPGISFYVFEAISYCVDIYRRRIRPAGTVLDFLCFISMFPRFIAGPIVRYADLHTQITSWTRMRLDRGLTLFATGFAMKCLFADQFAVFVPYAFEVSAPDMAQAWTGVIAYSLQLYFDFWSYSIMATGLGLCLGFEFPDNFRSPYHARSITQFWRMWHISLSTWLRDYLYFPLGGSRGAAWRTYANLFVTMLIGGLWHGASGSFVLWGGYHGLLLALERKAGAERMERLPRMLQHSATLLLVAVGWVFFKSASLGQAFSILGGMVGLHGVTESFNTLHFDKNTFSALCATCGIVFCIWGERLLVRDKPMAALAVSAWWRIGTLALFVVSLPIAFSSAEIPFLYFQF